jgi:N-acetyl-anhydromuramyl-L-alanine amidase AmpD
MTRSNDIIKLFGLFTILGLLIKNLMQLMITDKVGKLMKKPGVNYQIRSLSSIDQIIIHHSATQGGSSESFAEYHVLANDWPGIGYHFVINQSGQIDQTQYLQTVSYHTSGQNSRSVGICLVGDYDEQSLPPAQLDALILLILNIQNQLGRTLAIFGHNEFSNKTCPGSKVNIDQIRSKVQNLGA